MKPIWRQNNPKVTQLINQYYQLSHSDTENKKEKLKELKEQILREDLLSQLVWISLRTCAGIRCKDCYLKTACKTKMPALSSDLAAQIMKNQREKDKANADKTGRE